MGLSHFTRFSISLGTIPTVPPEPPVENPYDADSVLLFNRGDFTVSEKTIIDDCILKLKADSQWAHIYTLKIAGVSSEANALLCWKNAAYNSIKVGAPVFNQYSGHKGNSNAANYIRSGFNPNGIIVQNNCLFMGWEMSDATDASQLFGCQDGANEGIICLPKSTTSAITRLNSDGNDTVTQGGAPVGAWTLERIASGTYTVRIQKTLKQTYSKTSTSVPNNEIFFLLGNNNGTPGTAGARELGAFVAAHGDADYSLIFDAVNDCMVRLNALSI